jgi:hypothetical protein
MRKAGTRIKLDFLVQIRTEEEEEIRRSLAEIGLDKLFLSIGRLSVCGFFIRLSGTSFPNLR